MNPEAKKARYLEYQKNYRQTHARKKQSNNGADDDVGACYAGLDQEAEELARDYFPNCDDIIVRHFPGCKVESMRWQLLKIQIEDVAMPQGYREPCVTYQLLNWASTSDAL